MCRIKLDKWTANIRTGDKEQTSVRFDLLIYPYKKIGAVESEWIYGIYWGN